MNLDAYTAHLVDKDLAANTISSYTIQVQKFARWFQATNGEPLTGPNLTPTDVREYRSFLLNVEKAAARSVNNALHGLSSYGAWLVSSGQVDRNPVQGTREVRLEKAPPRWLEKQDQAKLLRTLERDLQAARTGAAKRKALRNHSLVLFMLHTGVRLDEVRHIEVDDVELGERSGKVQVRHGKGRKMRGVALNADARKVVREWLEVRPTEGGPQMWPGSAGQPTRARTIQIMLKEIGRRAGVEVTPHRLRHTFAKNLVNSGVELEHVAQLMGHDSLSTTAIYTTPSYQDLVRAVERLEG